MKGGGGSELRMRDAGNARNLQSKLQSLAGGWHEPSPAMARAAHHINTFSHLLNISLRFDSIKRVGWCRNAAFVRIESRRHFNSNLNHKKSKEITLEIFVYLFSTHSLARTRVIFGYGITGQVLQCRKSLGPIQKNCRTLTAQWSECLFIQLRTGLDFASSRHSQPGPELVTWSFSDDSSDRLNGP